MANSDPPDASETMSAHSAGVMATDAHKNSAAWHVCLAKAIAVQGLKIEI